MVARLGNRHARALRLVGCFRLGDCRLGLSECHCEVISVELDQEIPSLDRLVVHHAHRNHGSRNPRAERADIRVGLGVVGVLELARVAPPAAQSGEEYQDAKDDAQPHHRRLALGRRRLRFGVLDRPQLGSF